jgi:hypothetical protein
VEQMTEEMKHVVVTYTFIAGESQIPKSRLLSGNSSMTEREIIHEYMADFWGEQTKVEQHGSIYTREDDCEAIKINSYQPVSTSDAIVLRKYMYA